MHGMHMGAVQSSSLPLPYPAPHACGSDSNMSCMGHASTAEPSHSTAVQAPPSCTCAAGAVCRMSQVCMSVCKCSLSCMGCCQWRRGNFWGCSAWPCAGPTGSSKLLLSVTPSPSSTRARWSEMLLTNKPSKLWKPGMW